MNRAEAKIPTLAELWDHYKRRNRMGTIDPTSLKIYRRLFMQGASAAMIIQKAILDSTLTDEDGAFAMNMLDQECHEFVEGMESGKY